MSLNSKITNQHWQEANTAHDEHKSFNQVLFGLETCILLALWEIKFMGRQSRSLVSIVTHYLPSRSMTLVSVG